MLLLCVGSVALRAQVVLLLDSQGTVWLAAAACKREETCQLNTQQLRQFQAQVLSCGWPVFYGGSSGGSNAKCAWR